MDVRQAIRLSLRSAHNARYTDHIPAIDARGRIAAARSTRRFSSTRDYPVEFLDNIRVGEESGNLAESMELLSRQYHERAAAALKVITMLAGFAVWMVVAAIIIVMIFRLAFFYINTINSACSRMSCKPWTPWICSGTGEVPCAVHFGLSALT